MMDSPYGKTVIQAIRAAYAGLSQAEKRIADVILKNPEAAVGANVSALAELSGSSDATVIRFCKHIGYSGHYQMRLYLSRDLGRTQASAQAHQADSVNAYFRQLGEELSQIGPIIGQERMETCAQMLRACGRVHIIAAGNTSPLALYLGFRLERLGIKSSYNLAAEYALNHINLAEPHDVVLAISQSGASRQVIQALELAKARGLKIIAITAYPRTPVAALADCLLLTSADEPSAPLEKSYSHLREMAVADAVLHFVTNPADIAAREADKPELILSEYKL